MKATPFIIALLTTPAFFACKSVEKDEPIVCQQPTMAIAQGPCENSYADGVLIRVSGYDSGGQPRQFTYSTYPQKDTTSSDLTKSGYSNASTDEIIIPLAKLNNAPKFMVTVSMHCDGIASHTGVSVFAFVKRPTANAACYIWALQKQ